MPASPPLLPSVGHPLSPLSRSLPLTRPIHSLLSLRRKRNQHPRRGMRTGWDVLSPRPPPHRPLPLLDLVGPSSHSINLFSFQFSPPFSAQFFALQVISNIAFLYVCRKIGFQHPVSPLPDPESAPSRNTMRTRRTIPPSSLARIQKSTPTCLTSRSSFQCTRRASKPSCT